MPDPHVDIRSSSFTDDSSTALGLDHLATARRFSRASFVEHTITRAPAKSAEIAVLPEPSNDCRADLVGKSPEEMAQILARDDADRDAGFDYEREMQKVPGGRTPGTHSNSGGRKPQKPHPRPDFVGQPIIELDGPREFRPHAIAGRVSTQARHGLKMQAASIGDMMDVLGKALAVGVPWLEVKFTLEEMTTRQSVA